MNQQAPSMLKPALTGGVIFGVLGVIPYIKYLNVACCALIIGSGVLAAFLYAKACRPLDVPFAAGSGAKLGVLAGLFYWIVSGVGGLIIAFATGFKEIHEAADQMAHTEGVPQGLVDFYSSPGSVIGLGLVMGLVFGLLFATIGGLIGGAIFKVEVPLSDPHAGSTPPPPVA